MELELTKSQRVLIDEKNQLTEDVLNKYRVAAQVAQSGLTFIISLVKDRSSPNRTVGEICRLGDAFLNKAISSMYSDESGEVTEMGIATPVQIDKGTYISGMAPEEGVEFFQGGNINDGDVLKITLGVHIDGYTSTVSHTLIVWDNRPTQPFVGGEADAIMAAYIANEAVVALLGTAVKPENFAVSAQAPVTGTRIRSVVEKIAKTFRVKVVPGSRVRRVRRFLAGQSDTIQENDFKGVVWDEEEENVRVKQAAAAALSKETGSEEWEDVHPAEQREQFVVAPGEAWISDIMMAAVEGEEGCLFVKENKDYRPNMYTRDFTVTYGLRLNSSKAVAFRAKSVYPFKVSSIVDDKLSFNNAKLGLTEAVQHHMLVPVPVKALEFVPISAVKAAGTAFHSKARRIESTPTIVAREMSTVLLVPSSVSSSGYAEVVRLTGGVETAKPVWTHTHFEIQDEELTMLLTMNKDINVTGVAFTDVPPAQMSFDLSALSAAPSEMEIDA